MSNLTPQPVPATVTPPAPAMIPRPRTVILSPEQRQARVEQRLARFEIARRKTAGSQGNRIKRLFASLIRVLEN